MSVSIAGIPSMPVQTADHGQSGIAQSGISMRPSGSGETSSPVQVTFSPPSAQASGPMDSLGSGLIERLKAFEETRSQHRSAMTRMSGGPASPLEAAKAELLAGPASVRPSSGEAMAAPAGETGFNDAVNAMTRSFDYAIETQLIVKTGSQLSTSASSMMRGQ